MKDVTLYGEGGGSGICEIVRLPIGRVEGEWRRDVMWDTNGAPWMVMKILWIFYIFIREL